MTTALVWLLGYAAVGFAWALFVGWRWRTRPAFDPGIASARTVALALVVLLWPAFTALSLAGLLAWIAEGLTRKPDESDLKGRPKPIVDGQPHNISPAVFRQRDRSN
jgi:hypothetical protein